MRVWKLVHERLRCGHGGAELHTLHQRLRLWSMLSNQMHAIQSMLRQCSLHHRDGHQPLPSQLGEAVRQRRLVQSSESSLRHVETRLHEDRQLEGWHCPRHIPTGGLRSTGWPSVHVPRKRVLAFGVRDERRRRRRRVGDVGEREQDGVDQDEP